MSENTKNNLGLWQSAKFRVILAVVGLLIAVGVVVAVWHHRSQESAFQGMANVSSTPSIASVPGAGNPSSAYVNTQDLQNAEQAQLARQNAQSFVPTVTRPSFIGSTESFTQNTGTGSSSATDGGGTSNCPLNSVVYMFKPNPASCTVDNLKLARTAGVTAEELRCQSCSCPVLRLAGYTAGELKDTGDTAADLYQCGFSVADLKSAGYSANALKAAHISASALRDAGFSAGELAAAGFTPDQLSAAGYSAGDLAAAGITVASQDCSVSTLQSARAQGESAAEVHEQKGCGLAALQKAGYTGAELKAAGFTAKQLKDVGFSAQQLKALGYSAAALKDAGFSDADLAQAGFSADQIKAADEAVKICSSAALKAARAQGVSAATLAHRGCELAALKAAGYTADALKAAGFSAAELANAGFPLDQLTAAGFNASQLKAAGFTPAQIRASELAAKACDVSAMKKARMIGVSATALKDKGCGLSALQAAGYTPVELKNAGFTAAQLKAAGMSAQQLKDAGFSVSALKAAGFNAEQLKKAGLSAGGLSAAGFSAGELKAAGFSADALKAAGFNPSQLRKAGFTAAALKAAGFSADALRHAGYTKGDLLRAGYSAEAAGYDTTSLPPPAVIASSQPGSAAMPENTGVVNTSPASVAGGGGDSDAMPSITSNSPEARLRAIQALQQQELSDQQQRDAVQQMQGQMNLQAQKLMAEWSNNSAQTYAMSEQEPVASATSASNGNQTSQQPSGPTIKAGSILFGVLDTSINSDEKSPILATIVTGNLKGSKLVGNFVRVNKRVLLQFNLLNVPALPRTLGVNVVAIDPDTARTALAGDVNSHYLLRYGTLFASAFLSGLSQGILESGATQECFLGFCQTQYKNLNTGEYVALGLGKVGQQYATVMGSNFNTPPTVTVPGGAGIGLLFMSDVTLPTPLPSNTN
ncbi:MAG: type IV secretion protein IcmE [Gammaproteobacteria bacterium RIFCSPHIGHO2_12_FULL_41_15]|nr:MAG: type IV secretion protein IcmE [Gammaproteobacteria bacterium RIFCSPHIGHO2_12_FULL_41_15]